MTPPKKPGELLRAPIGMLTERDMLHLRFTRDYDELKEMVERVDYYLSNLPGSLQPSARNLAAELREKFNKVKP